MYRSMDEVGPPLSQDDIAALERQLKLSLPRDYVAFLLQYNGGSPMPDTVPVQDWPEGGPEADVRTIYGIGSSPQDDTEDLRWNLACYAGRMPSGLVPIATTSCGDQFCLWLTGKERGAIVLWDHEAEHRPPTTANLHRIAPTFAAFLELLHDSPDD